MIHAPSSYSVPGFPGQSQTFADLYYNRYRDYDSSTGRYIQADPIGLDGGAEPYSYAMNNPLRYTDPTGEFVPLALCAIGAAVGGSATALGDLLGKGSTSVYSVGAGAAVGCASGVAAPAAATSTAGALLLGGVANVSQYAITTYLDDCEEFSLAQAATSFGFGLLGGGLAGKFRPVRTVRRGKNQTREDLAPTFFDTPNKRVNRSINGGYLTGGARGSFGRGVGAGAAAGAGQNLAQEEGR